MKSLIKNILRLLLFILFVLIGFLLFSTFTDYQPIEKINLFKDSQVVNLKEKNFTIMTWNIGYAGLGSNMDFFYDGGKSVRDTKKRTLKNLKNITNFIASQNTVDFILLQEVDVDSKRTYYINERDSIENSKPNFLSLYANNYLVKFVPVPLTNPMGYVHGGLQTLSKSIPAESNRFSFPGNYDWPTSLFMLDRCFLSNRYQLFNNKELIVINTHNSAFDDGSLKNQQMEYLKIFVENEYSKGNYVVVGGDWNQNPPGLDPSKFGKYDESNKFKLSSIDQNFLPEGWQWVYDSELATNRSNVTPYEAGESSTTVLDYFLISPNLKANFVSTIDLEFKNSDHQPVFMNFTFN